MAAIVSSIEIARPPQEVFSYVTDPSRLTEWQESVVTARAEGTGSANCSCRSSRAVRRRGRCP